MKTPKIGIIIPVGDSENFIEKFISNYIDTIKKYNGIIETILVCNNSSNKCFEIINNFANSNIRVYDLGKCTNGISKARNYGLKMLSSDVEFVCFLDDDDSLNKKGLEKILEYIDIDADIICFEWSEIINEEGQAIHRYLPRKSIEKNTFIIQHDLSQYLILRRYLLIESNRIIIY